MWRDGHFCGCTLPACVLCCPLGWHATDHWRGALQWARSGCTSFSSLSSGVWSFHRPAFSCTTLHAPQQPPESLLLLFGTCQPPGLWADYMLVAGSSGRVSVSHRNRQKTLTAVVRYRLFPGHHHGHPGPLIVSGHQLPH